MTRLPSLAVDNPWLERRVLNYAHQGGAREGPSSTLHAMRRAVAAGARAIELDVHATADRQLVVCHDPTVDRTTDGAGRIADLTWAQIQGLDNAYWWVPDRVVDHEASDDEFILRGQAAGDPDLRVPLLRQVLETFPGIYLNLDIKQTSPAVEPYEQLLADLLREFGRSDDVIVTSFADESTDAFGAAAPEVSTAAGTQATAAFYFAAMQGESPPPTTHHALQVPPAFGGVTVVTDQFVAAAHAHGLAVHVWTIDEADEMEALADVGVDGIMTDRPTILAEVLNRRSA